MNLLPYFAKPKFLAKPRYAIFQKNALKIAHYYSQTMSKGRVVVSLRRRRTVRYFFLSPCCMLPFPSAFDQLSRSGCDGSLCSLLCEQRSSSRRPPKKKSGFPNFFFFFWGVIFQKNHPPQNPFFFFFLGIFGQNHPPREPCHFFTQHHFYTTNQISQTEKCRYIIM